MSIDPRDASSFGPETLRIEQRALEQKAERYAKLHPESGDAVDRAGPIRRALRRLRGRLKRRD